MNSPHSCAEMDIDETAEPVCTTCVPSAEPAIRPLTVTVYGPDSTPDGFTALAAEWNPLLQRSQFNSLFLTHEWQTTWWRHLGEGDLWILAFRQPETNELVGIVPLYLVTVKAGKWAGKRKFNLVGCIEVSDYLDAIILKGWEESVYRELLTWLRGSEAPQWDILDLCNLPEVSLTQQVMPALCEALDFRVEVSQEDTAPQFRLPLQYDQYLDEQVEKKQRHEIRRKQRRAEREADISFTIVENSPNLTAEVDDFIALQRASRADKAEFMTPEMRRFFNAAAQVMADAGYLRLCFLSINGEKAATLFAFEYDKRFWLYNSGYDPNAYAQLSPGWVILSYSIQYAIAVGCTVFDFMQGNEEYKYRFGGQDYQVMRVLVYNPA